MAVCPELLGDRGTSPIEFSVLCAVGAEILDAAPIVEGTGKSAVTCGSVRYRLNADAPVQARVVCPGDETAMSSGTQRRDTAINRGWQEDELHNHNDPNWF